jgi:nicotinamidase/pyrazinamidase
MELTKRDALLIVDVQNDFLPGGALAVSEGDQVIPVINLIQGKFDFIVATQDFHPADHKSFAANHEAGEIGQLIEWQGNLQILWPVHCVQQTHGTEFHLSLDQKKWKAVIRKGTNPDFDSYSGFFDNSYQIDTGLAEYLKRHGIDRVFICGLALDYCVKFTALDAKELEFDTYLITDATRAVNLNPEDGIDALADLEAAGIKLITSKEL